MYPYYILIALSVLLFFGGFFPISKSNRKFNNKPPTHVNNVELHQDKIYLSEIDKTVLLVIDALRLDFVNPHYMPLTANILKQKGCFNTVKVETPTVTLPRIKALIAGNVPQFIDLVLNLASSEVLEDSLIHSAYYKQKNIVFYGDDTWLKIVKNIFVRYEGTSSFFVRDFKEVDDNVTRNLNIELQREDWDMMILHYLGLDHIGHVYGPYSSLVPVKLREMDEIVYKIYSEVKSNKKLLVITGDHGMRDSGGHGGATYSETHVPLLMLGHECTNGSFPQIDIPANLAVLLGLDIPTTSIGQLRENLLPFTLDKYLFTLRYNTLLLIEKLAICGDSFEFATKFHEMYILNPDKATALKAIDYYKNCSEKISDKLINSSVEQNFSSLIIAVLVMFNLLFILLNNLVNNKKEQNSQIKPFLILQYLSFLIILLIHFTSVITPILLFSIFVLSVFLVLNLILMFKHKHWFSDNVLFIAMMFTVSIIHPLTFISSSFVEEEHQFWYFMNNTLFLFNIVTFIKIRNVKSSFSWLFLFIAIRFLRTINSTGDKWANYPDLSDWLLKEENVIYYQIFSIFGLGTVLYSQYNLIKGTNKLKPSILNLIILSLIFTFKNADFNNIFLGKLIWLLIFGHVLWFHDFLQMWVLISSLMLKPYNVILISYCIYASLSYSLCLKDTSTIILSHLWLGNMLYFTQGHSNSLASVDISVGYIGLSEYQPVFVIAQVLCHTYSLPILCQCLVFRKHNIDKSKVWEIVVCNRLYITIIVCIITFILRHHLFIWSVFAPKLFIECIHCIMLFLEVSIYYSYQQIQNFFLQVIQMYKKNHY